MCRLKDFERIFEYDGNATCAADGMCQEKCPVKINTGELIKAIRAEDMSKQTSASKLAMVASCAETQYPVALESFLVPVVLLVSALCVPCFAGDRSQFLRSVPGYAFVAQRR